jgi:glycine/D-amino acid oxidase-like deaminating enzyme
VRTKTIIVGGGIAGLSCAFRLLEAGQDALLITEDLGGRIKYAPAEQINYGAYFVMRGYAQARKLVSPGAWINPADACFHNSASERFVLISGHTLRRLPELLRFLLLMRRFAAHYERYKRRCLTIAQRAALDADPYLKALFSQPAAAFIREHGIENAAADYVAKFAYACTGAEPEQLTALDFLNVSLGMLTPIYHLVFDCDAVAARLGEHLIYGRVTTIARGQDGFQVGTADGATCDAEHVVVATPAAVTQQLLGLREIREASRFYVFRARATLKPIYRHNTLNLFPLTSSFMLIAREWDGTYLIYARAQDVDLHEVCEDFEVLRTVAWERAMYVHGRAFMEQQPEPGLYIAGDHNGLGLEPAAISGIFAANQIIKEEV